MTPLAPATANLLTSRLSPAALLRVLLEPVVIQLSFWTSVWANGEQVSAPMLMLALFAFFLSYPGRLSFSRRPAALALDILTEWLGVGGVLLTLGWATHYLREFPPGLLETWAWLTPATLFAAYLAIPLVVPRLLALEGGPSRAVVVGAGKLGQSLAQQFISTPLLGVKLVGFFDDRNAERIGAVNQGPLLGNLASVGEFVKANRVDLVYITLPMGLQPRSLAILDQLRDTTASIYFAPDIFLLDLIQARMDHINGIPVVAACESPFYGINGLVKRASDVVLAALILLLVAPAMLVIALLVKASSPGPVLFKQRRYGLDGREIVVYKFRSMTVCEDGGVIRQATRDDQRITPIGRFLRKTSLDELPQFLNVLQGRMSVVGPRPHAIAHNEEYRKRIKGYMVRHKVRPGITGWAQVNGFRGETDRLEKMESRIEHDLEYLRNWSLRLDLSIILKTVWLVAKDRQAY